MAIRIERSESLFTAIVPLCSDGKFIRNFWYSRVPVFSSLKLSRVVRRKTLTELAHRDMTPIPCDIASQAFSIADKRMQDDAHPVPAPEFSRTVSSYRARIARHRRQ